MMVSQPSLGGEGAQHGGGYAAAQHAPHAQQQQQPQPQQQPQQAQLLVTSGPGVLHQRQAGDKVHFCISCQMPIAVYGRLLPCAHAFCLTCASDMPKCFICHCPINRLERITQPLFISAVTLQSFHNKESMAKHTQQLYQHLVSDEKFVASLQQVAAQREQQLQAQQLAQQMVQQQQQLQQQQVAHEGQHGGGGSGDFAQQAHESLQQAHQPEYQQQQQQPQQQQQQQQHYAQAPEPAQEQARGAWR